MAINIRAVRLQAPASNTTQDYTITSFGTVQAAIIIAGTAGNVADTAPLRQSFGFWDTTNTVGWFNHYADSEAIATAATRSGQSNSNIVEMLTGGVGTERSATISAVTDGIRLTWAGSDTSNQPYVIAILINGINGAQAGASTPNASDGGTTVETTTGITPKVVFCGQNRGNVADADTVWATASFGFAYNNGSAIEQRSLAWNMPSGSSTGNLIIDTNRAASNVMSAQIDTQQEITAMASGSFTQTTRNVSGTGAEDSDLYYLALDFNEGADTFSDTVPIASGDYTIDSGASFTPTAGIILTSFATTADSLRTDNTSGHFGVWVGTASEKFQLGWSYEDGAATNSNTSGRTDTRLYNADETGGTDFVANNFTFGAGGMTWTDANNTEGSQASYIVGILFAPASAGNPHYYYAQQ